MLNSFIKIKYSRSSPDTENFCCVYQQPYNFFPVFADSGHFRETQLNQNWSVRSTKISCNRRLFFWLSLLEPFENNLYFVFITGEPVLYTFLIYFTSVLLSMMRSQSVSMAWTVTCVSAFYHSWRYKKHCYMN